MTKHDREALTLAMQKAAEDPMRRDQIASMMEDQPWAEVAEFCAAVCQSSALNLEPWSLPPCRGDSEHHPDLSARKLLEQMLALGISRFHPSPLEAIEQAKLETVK